MDSRLGIERKDTTHAVSIVVMALSFTLTAMCNLTATQPNHKRQRPRVHGSCSISSLSSVVDEACSFPQNPDASPKGKAPPAHDVPTV